MKLSIRITYAFAEIVVDEIETTIFDIREIDETIDNLNDVIDELLILRKNKEALKNNQSTHTHEQVYHRHAGQATYHA